MIADRNNEFERPFLLGNGFVSAREYPDPEDEPELILPANYEKPQPKKRRLGFNATEEGDE